MVWKKILYEDQGYPDNYTDKTFLKELKTNIDHEEITFLEAVLGASVVVQELCTVIVFALTYLYLYNGWVDPSVVFYTSSLLTFIGFCIFRKTIGDNVCQPIGHDVRTVLIFLVFGQLFSPVLHTLTDTISTDTIYTMASFMMLIHLIFFDYGVPAAIVSNSLSLSAIVFASICLASRLASPYHAFVLITVAVEIFVLFPILRTKFRKSILMVLFLISLVVCVLSFVSTGLTVLFICTLFLINIVCPLLFIRYQYWKDNIYGPWDEAIVNDAEDISDLIYS